MDTLVACFAYLSASKICDSSNKKACMLHARVCNESIRVTGINARSLDLYIPLLWPSPSLQNLNYQNPSCTVDELEACRKVVCLASIKGKIKMIKSH